MSHTAPVRRQPDWLRASRLAGFLLLAGAPLSGFSEPPPPHVEPNVFEVKFSDSVPVRLKQNRPHLISPHASKRLSARTTTGMDRLQSEGCAWTRLFPTLPETELDRQRARARSGAPPPPDMNNYFKLEVPRGADPAEVLTQLRNFPEVEHAFYAPRPAPPPVPPDYSDSANPSGSYQRYLDAALDGIDARYAWTHPGGDGTGVTICDIEYDWNENHQDLPAVQLLNGPIQDFGFGNNHGTAVMGMLVGLDNGYGVKGIAHGASAAFSPAGTATGGYNPAGAILTAVSNLDAGDVILVEQQTTGPNGDFVPAEWVKSVYDAIVSAVAQGIVVVEAAGNGGENLDDAIYSTGNGGHYPFLAQNDSGAMIVGAGAPASAGQPRSRLSFSTYGSTVDLQGWGSAVLTTGYGYFYSSEGVDLNFTASFNGTSSASPCVAGAAAALQGILLAASTTPATPAQIRDILVNTGTPQTGSDHIGPLPDLYAAIQFLLTTIDSDEDGVPDINDNCPETPNADQSDLDSDEIGDACDPDRDGDDLLDIWEELYAPTLETLESGSDGDGDLVLDEDEYEADTHPLDLSSYLHFTDGTSDGSNVTVTWRCGVEATQILYRADPPLSNEFWTAIFTNVPPTSTNGVHIDPGAILAPGMYRLEADRP